MTDLAMSLPSSVKLEEDQRQGIDAAASWSTDAFSALGSAYMHYEEALARYEQAKLHLEACTKTARHAEKQGDQVMATIAKSLKLPPGEWVYDKKTGDLVKKERPDAKSS